ncbi:DUF1772 domain-containing protein [Aeromicrobium sp. CF4.19]|uniref:anthrone oxygenase family protein n=1 Tax=Aeromicrobium sp. CF4.19 TaxID=3373082 RepID=UPI003EE64A2E
MMLTVLALVTTVLAGLDAGLFAAFSYAVMPGLRRTPDRVLVAAMRGINVAIINPVFAVVFGGTLVAGVVTLTVAVVEDAATAVIVPVAVGVALHVTTIAVTMVVNVPLNDALEASDDADPTATRRAFEPRWVAWNHLRSLTSAGALVAFAVALLAVAA